MKTLLIIATIAMVGIFAACGEKSTESQVKDAAADAKAKTEAAAADATAKATELAK